MTISIPPVEATMKTIAIAIFDGFTDIDLFLMWDILKGNTTDWQLRILGTKSALGVEVRR